MKNLKIVTWNINSVRLRIEFIKKLKEDENPDIICLQECKAQEKDFPFETIKEYGYEHIAYYGMKGYNGVAILSKTPLKDIRTMDWVGRENARHVIATTIDDIEIHNIYIPAGRDEPDYDNNPSFAHKLDFLDEISDWFKKHQELADKKVLVCGDFNIAPLENDVWSHKQLLKVISHTPIEVEKLTNFYNSINFYDAVRCFYPESDKLYSWWSYRARDWVKSNRGRRLDHLWVTQSLKPAIKAARILTKVRGWERPSDHAPVVVELEI